MFKKKEEEKKEKYQGDPDSVAEPKGAIKWILEILFILLLIPIATISYKAADPFRHNEKIPESLRDFATSDFMGIQPYIVVSNSMQGSASDDFNAGDLVIAMVTTADDIKEGDVVSYTVGDPLDRYIVIHRVLTDNGDGTYIFKGDANNVQDANPVSADQIQAKYVFHIAKLGFVIQFIGEHRLQIVLGIVAVYCIIAVVDAIKNPDDDEDDSDDGDGDSKPVDFAEDEVSETETTDKTVDEIVAEEPKQEVEEPIEEIVEKPVEEIVETTEPVIEDIPAKVDPYEKEHNETKEKMSEIKSTPIAQNLFDLDEHEVEEIDEETMKAINENSGIKED